MLVSRHQTHLQFKNYLTQVRSDVGSRVDMFVVRPEGGHPVIFEVPKERNTLDALGVRELTDIVIFDSELQSEVSTNKSEYFHIIG